MRKLLASVIAALIGIAFVTTGFAQDNKTATTPKEQSVSTQAPTKDKPAVKKSTKTKTKVKKSKKAGAKPEKKAEPETPATPAEK